MSELGSTAKISDWVKVRFIGRLESGEVFDASPEDEDLEFQIGSEVVLPGFENNIIGMTVNQEKEFKITPEMAYGERDEKALQTFLRSEFPDDLADPQAGQIILIGTVDDKAIPGRIKEVAADNILVDLNHPLAGEVLIFKVMLLSISKSAGEM